MSFTIKDVSTDDVLIQHKNNREKSKSKFSKKVLSIFILYALLYALIHNGQVNGKVFIQNELFKNYNETLTVTYLSLIVLISRIMRIAGNIAFGKIYYKLKDKVGVMLVVLLGLSFVFLSLGYFIKSTLILKFISMSIGFFIILSVRDPIKLYFQDLVLKHTGSKEQQSALTWLHFCRKLGISSLGFIISAALLRLDMIYVILGMMFISIFAISLMIKISSVLKKEKINEIKIEENEYRIESIEKLQLSKGYQLLKKSYENNYKVNSEMKEYVK